MSEKHLIPFIFVFFAFLSAFHLYVHQPKMVDLPNIPHAINSWQFLQGKETAYWMYFGLYIRWSSGNIMGSTVAMDQYISGTTQGLLFMWSYYAILKHVNQSTNFCFTTLESWSFLMKREALVIDICGKSCCLFSTKNCLRILPDAVDASLPRLYTNGQLYHTNRVFLNIVQV